MVRIELHRGVRPLLGAAAVLLGVLGPSAVQPLVQPDPDATETFGPTLAVDPASGLAGDVIAVSGSGWVANSPVTLRATPVGEQMSVLLGEASPTSAAVLLGGPAFFDTAVTIPGSAPGDLSITACQSCDDPDSSGASVSFVVLPPETPTDTSAGGTTVTPSPSTTAPPDSATPTSANTPSIAPVASLLSGLVLPLLAVAGGLVVMIVVATVGLVRSRTGVRAGQPVSRLSATSRPDPVFSVHEEAPTGRAFPNLRLVPHPTAWTVAIRKESER